VSDGKSIIKISREDDLATLTLDRPAKRNAINDQLVDELDQFFGNPPDGGS